MSSGHRGHTADPGVQALERLERNQVRHHLVDTEPLRKPSTAGTMGGMGRLGELLRGLQRARSSLGSAAAPSPVELPVPEDLRQAVEEELGRRSREHRAD